MSTLLNPSSFAMAAQGAEENVRRVHQALASQIENAFATFAKRLRQRREWIATRDEIATLDAATLRDLGLRRSEADSVAAEAHGIAEATRRRVLESRVDPRPV
jgi:uncharacterized protein YjiS (DUF1127 family)